jgi:hypothetical protein
MWKPQYRLSGPFTFPKVQFSITAKFMPGALKDFSRRPSQRKN